VARECTATDGSHSTLGHASVKALESGGRHSVCGEEGRGSGAEMGGQEDPTIGTFLDNSRFPPFHHF